MTTDEPMKPRYDNSSCAPGIWGVVNLCFDLSCFAKTIGLACALSLCAAGTASAEDSRLQPSTTYSELGFRFQSMVFWNAAGVDASFQTSRHVALGATSGAVLLIDPTTCDGPFDSKCSNPHYLGFLTPFLELRFDASTVVSPYARIHAGVAVGPGAFSGKRTAGFEPVPLLGLEGGIAIHGASPGLVGRVFVYDEWIFPMLGAQMGWRF